MLVVSDVNNPRGASEASRILLDELEEGQTDMGMQMSATDLDLEDRQFRMWPQVETHLTVKRCLQTFTVTGIVSFGIKGECCRCLRDIEQPLQAELGLLIQRCEAAADLLEATADDEDVEIVDPGAKEVDLHERIRDAVMLEFPMRAYCRDDCKGLCSHCGQDLNESECGCTGEKLDPRWQALAKLKES